MALRTVDVYLSCYETVSVEMEVDELGNYDEDNAYRLALKEIESEESCPIAVHRTWEFDGTELDR